MLISEGGEVLVAKQAFYETNFPAPGWAEQDPLLILRSVNELIASCNAGASSSIVTVSFSSAMHSLMAVDSEGNPLTPLILWSDMRSAPMAKGLRSDHRAADLYNTTGTPIHPMSPLCKLLWFRQADSGLFSKAFKFISIKEFIVWHWCGTWTVDYSIASATGMFDVHRLQWSAQALDVTGITAGRLSEPVSPYTRVAVKENMSKQLGLKAGLTVTLGASDGCLANLGSEATGPGDLSITIGTSGAVRMVSDKPCVDPYARLFNYRLDEHRFVSGGATNNGTIVIDWFMKNFLRIQDAHLDDFLKRALPVEPGSEGLLFLPFVFGERAPYHNPDMRGLFFGLAQHHTIDHMAGSILDGICFEIRSLVDAVEESVRPIGNIWASGGFVRSDGWVQRLANVLGREVRVRDVNDASSIGAARMGFQATGIHPTFTRKESERSFNPDLRFASVYGNLFDIFTRIAGQLDDEFSEIASLQTLLHLSDIKRKT